MESEQMNEFRPLILVAEDDDSNFKLIKAIIGKKCDICLLYTSPSPRDKRQSRMPSSA